MRIVKDCGLGISLCLFINPPFYQYATHSWFFNMDKLLVVFRWGTHLYMFFRCLGGVYMYKLKIFDTIDLNKRQCNLGQPDLGVPHINSHIQEMLTWTTSRKVYLKSFIVNSTFMICLTLFKRFAPKIILTYTNLICN